MQSIESTINTVKGSKALVAAIAIAGCIQPAIADDWKMEVTPYAFAAGIDATAGIGNLETDVDMSSSDVIDSLDNAFMGVITAQKGNWIFGFDGAYLNLQGAKSNSVTGDFGLVTVDGAIEANFRQWVYMPMVGYQLLDDKIKWDVYGGARYTQLKANLEVSLETSIIQFPGGSLSAKRDKNWIDYVVGTHVVLPLGEKWSLTGLVDAGTGSDSDMSYQAMATIKWQFQENMAAHLGYRILHQEYNDDAFDWDVTYDGIVLGLGFKF